jgi:hypothetical protein
VPPPVVPPAAVQPQAVQPQAVQPQAVQPQAVQPQARKPEVAADQPAARLPTAEVASKPKPVAATQEREAQPGDRICGSCSAPNDATRKFCRRCGASLTAAQIVAAKKLPWWKRLFGSGKAPKQYAAGERTDGMQPPKPSGNPIARVAKAVGPVRGVLALLVALGFIGYIAVPSIQGTVNGIIQNPTGIVDRIRKLVAPELVAVRPVTIAGSSAIGDHPADLAFDTFTNTDWQVNDKVPSVTVTFAEPVDLGATIIQGGFKDTFTDLRRPAKLAFDYPDGSSQTIDLEDVPDAQTFDLNGSGVDEVTIRVVATYGPEDQAISLSEIELFKKE